MKVYVHGRPLKKGYFQRCQNSLGTSYSVPSSMYIELVTENPLIRKHAHRGLMELTV